MKTYVLCGMLLLCGCHKMADAYLPNTTNTPATTAAIIDQPSASGFIQYIIKSGEHYAGNNAYRPVEVSEMAFAVRFDSSAVYTTQAPVNQYDINKLYGFSDNGTDHHQYSARFGWAWNGGRLRLYAYVYNARKVTAKELGAVPIGAVVNCRIKITSTAYLFTWGDETETLPRTSTTAKGKGYQLYPYFGGDEAAPHDIRIWIKSL